MNKKTVIILIVVMFFAVLTSVSIAQKYLQPLKGTVFCLDPGSGGELYYGSDKDEVANAKLRAIEAKANLRIALFLKYYLEDAGAKVILTRSTHTPPFPNSGEKAKICQSSGANFFIGIHHNYSRDSSVNYISCIVKQDADKDTVALATSLSQQLSADLNLENLGLSRDKLEIFKYLNTPAVVLSVGFLTNKKFRRFEEKLEHNHNIALSIFKGILNFYERQKVIVMPPATPTPQPTLQGLPPLFPIRTPTETPIAKITPVSTPALPVRTPIATTLKPLRLTPVPTPAPLTALTPTPVTPLRPIKEIVSKPTAPFAPPFLNPVDGYIDQTWLYGEKWGNWPLKYGISFNVDPGTTVKAIADGEVLEADDSGNPGLLSPYPNYVLIKHNDKINNKEVYSLYAQLASITVKKGDKVQAGDKIGTTGEPFASSNNRSTEFEFEIRIGGPTQEYVQNPELFIKHIGEPTGCIIGRIVDANNNPIPGLRITGVTKPLYCAPYSFSMTYGEGVNSTERWNENFAICDVYPGEYVLNAQSATKKVVVEPNMVTVVIWTIE
ncbi:N-acetylmuramoyl-L-alanine amidase [Candidatus Sumerlaeota bacterium]|nr:N-acetylmuramoyl-L-alanine amidase [Candidatus Sumerlaeota bacterium]